MTTMTVAITRAVVTAAGLLVVVTTVLVAAFRLDPVGLGLAGLAIASLSVPLVGAAATRAQRRNPVGWLLLLTGVSIPLAVSAYLYAHAADTGADLPGASWAGWLDAWPWTPALTLVPVLGLLLFPTGRPPSRGWRVLMWTGIVVLAAQLLNGLLAPHLLDFPDRNNPTGLSGAAGSAADALGATIVAVPVLATAGAWALHLRWRRAARAADDLASDPALAAALGLAVPAGWLIAASWWGCGVAIAATGNSNDALVPELLGIVALAAAAWAAIYRYRLFDARQVLSRTLVYAGLTLCVLAIYFAVATAVGAVARGTVSQPVAVVVAVALALPVQGALRRWVTRLVYGDRDDPYSALVQLGRRLEDAAEPDDVLPAVARTIRRALRLEFVGIQVGEMTVRAGTDHGESDQFPLVFAGETIGSLTVSRPEGRPTRAGRDAAAGRGHPPGRRGRARGLAHHGYPPVTRAPGDGDRGGTPPPAPGPPRWTGPGAGWGGAWLAARPPADPVRSRHGDRPARHTDPADAGGHRRSPAAGRGPAAGRPGRARPGRRADAAGRIVR